jgi:diketogulonate reductase-like aldo/keto reductase
MLRRRFGATKDDVAVIGQGTWQMRDPVAAAAALREGVALGMTHIDTAELYTGSEAMIGGVIAGRREEVFLVSKVLPRHASYRGTMDACAASLRRLGTDHVDLYLLHWWSDEHSIEETMRALAELADRGTTRHIGVSNFDVHELEAAKRALGGSHRLVSNQVLYHLGARGIEAEVLPWCKRNGVAVVAYSPFGSTRGFPSPSSAGGRVLADIARRLGKTPRQIALAFLTRDPDVFAIPKTESIAHVRENAGGAFTLDKGDIDAIDRAFPMVPGLTFL